MNSYQRTRHLDLPDGLLDEIEISVNQNKIYKSKHKENKHTGKSWLDRVFYKHYFKQGWFHVHTLEPAIEEKILAHYQPFIDLLGEIPKVRIKVAHNVIGLPLHSDSTYGGDRSSIVTLIKGNTGITSWYNSDSTKFKSSLWNFLTLKKISSVKFIPRLSYFFNNDRVHGVSNCDPDSTRYLLVISWRNVKFADLISAYDKLYKDSSK